VVFGVGAGFTGRLSLGQAVHRWSEVADYVRALRSLLRGEEVEWEGSVIKMLHPAGFAPHRPIEPPILLATQGPKGLAVAHDVADGIITAVPLGGFSWVAHILQGTVLDPGEDPGSQRAIGAGGHAAALLYHLMYDVASFPEVETLPGGAEFRRRAELVPERTRHLAVHENHLIALNTLDEGLITGEVMSALGAAADADTWRARLQSCVDAGVTELLYQPAGDDIDRELRVFAQMAGL
jgi:5,10-methylenetetrahydromethanopterin reductase